MIDILFNQERKSISKIVKILDRSKFTIYRELKRNTFDDYYNHEITQRKTIKRKDLLRTTYAKGGKRTKGIFSKFTNSLVIPIWAWPKYIDNRSEFGHWERNGPYHWKKKTYFVFYIKNLS